MCWNTGFLIKKQFNQLIVLVLYRSYLGLVHYVELSHHWLIRLGDILLVFFWGDLSLTTFTKNADLINTLKGDQKEFIPASLLFLVKKNSHDIFVIIFYFQRFKPYLRKSFWVAILLYKAWVKLESADRLN